MYTQSQNHYPYSYYPPVPPAPSPEQQKKKQLRSDGNYLGFMMLLLVLTMQFTFTAVALLLVSLGVVSPDGLMQEDLGLGNTKFLLVYSVVYALSMGVPALVASALCRRLRNPFAPAKPVAGGMLFLAVLAAVGLCMVANIVTNVFTSILYEWGLPVPEFPQFLEPTGTSLGMNIFVLAVLPALLEEMVFRGFVLRTLRPYGDLFAVLVSAFLFGLMHGNIEQVPFALIVGIVLGWLYVATDNIWVPILIHFTNNALSVCMEFLGFDLSVTGQAVFYTAAIYGLAALGIVAFCILLACYYRKLQPKNKESVLTSGQRTGALLSAPAFLIAVIIFIGLLIWGMFA